MKKIIVQLSIILATVAAVATVVSKKVLYHSVGSSEFSLSEDSSNIRKVSASLPNYQVYRSFSGDTQTLYLLESKTVRSYFLDAEGVQGSQTWTVKSGNQFEKTLWSKSDTGSILTLNSELGLVLSGQEGCCAEITGYRMYDIRNGNLIMSFNDFVGDQVVYSPYVLEVPNSTLSARFIGLITGDSTRDQDFVPATGGMMNTALVKYSSVEGPGQKFQIDMLVADGFAPTVMDVKLVADPSVPDSSKIAFTDGGRVAQMWNIDGETDATKISGVVLVLTVNGGQANKMVRIPVLNDKLSLESAEIPAGVSLRQL
jgi:hypothetical protein